MRRVISVLSLAVLCLLCTACGWTKPVPLPEEDAISEAPALTRDLPVAEALQRGAVQSILVIGDSISDGNTPALPRALPVAKSSRPTATPTMAASGGRMSVKRWGAG